MIEHSIEAETPETPEWSPEEQQLIKALKERRDAPETMAFLQKWTDEQQERSTADPEGQIRLTLRRAHLYLAAGMLNEAHENFEDVETYAEALGLDDFAR